MARLAAAIIVGAAIAAIRTALEWLSRPQGLKIVGNASAKILSMSRLTSAT